MAALIRSGAVALAACFIFAASATAQSDSYPQGTRVISPPVVVSQYDSYERYEADEYLTPIDEDALQRAHISYLSDGALQLTRPEEEYVPPPERAPPPDWLSGLFEALSALGPVFKWVFYAIIALVVAGILYFLFGEAIRMRLGFKPKTEDKTEDDVLIDIRPDAEQARSLLEQADALAREGRFAEAVHLLLFRSIEDIQERLEGGVPTSLTAREIAHLRNLPDRARRALSPIIRIVEQSFFGGRPVDSTGWQDARRSYEEFAFGEGWA